MEIRRKSDGNPIQPLRFRPHHFLCALGFRGKGYSDAFTAGMARHVALLRSDPATMIEVVPGIDAICGPCPKRSGSQCFSQEKIDRLDAAHAAALGLSPGDRLSWAEALDRIRAAVRPSDLASLCAGCRWLSLGLCESALTRLHAARPTGERHGSD